jgi:hypothetical protein
VVAESGARLKARQLEKLVCGPDRDPAHMPFYHIN